MTKFQRWSVIALAVWGVPAIFFWAGVGFYLQMSLRWEVNECLKQLNQTVFSFFEAGRDHGKKLWGRIFEEVSSVPAFSPDLKTKAEAIEGRFPPGAVKIAVFNGEGNLVYCSSAGIRSEIQRWFDFVRRPWTEKFSIPSNYFDAMEAAIPGAYELALKMRNKPGIIQGLDPSEKSKSDITTGLFQWVPDREAGKVGGLMVLMCAEKFPRNSNIEEILNEIKVPDVLLGFYGEDGNPVLNGVPPGVIAKAVRQFHRETGNRFLLEDYVVEGRILHGTEIIFAMKKIPPRRFRMLGFIFFVYFLGSLFILVSLYKHVFHGVPLRLSLLKKLFFLFFLGVAFPMCGSIAISFLYIDEKRAEILAENQKSAFKKLDSIDSGIEKVLISREIMYRKLCAEFASQKKTPQELSETLFSLQNRGCLEDFYLVSSQSEVILAETSPQEFELSQVLRLPIPGRIKFLDACLKKGETPYPEDVEFLMGWKDIARMPRRRMKQAEVSDVARFLVPLSEDLLNEINSRKGLSAPSRKKLLNVGLKGLIESEGKMFFRALRANLGRLIPSGPGEYLFSDVLYGPDGGAWYTLSLSHNILNLQQNYLHDEVAGENKNNPDHKIIVVGFDDTYAPTFPTLEDAIPLENIRNRFFYSRENTFTEKMVLDGVPVEIAARRGKSLKRFHLFQVTPLNVLEAELARYKSKTYIFILGTGLFCFLAAWLFLQKILVPLQDLSLGMRALREKKFQYRVPKRSNDELGQLCSALNKTIEHLSEMETASIIQRNLLPQEAMISHNFLISGRNLMTQAIGGDYYDFFPLPDGNLAVILGDVSGHGVSAAQVTAMAKAGFTLLCSRFPREPSLVLQKLNAQFLALLKRKKMMTCFLGILNPRTGKFFSANAGQCFPILISGQQEGDYIEMISTPLGMIQKNRPLPKELEIAGKDLVLYTDGLIEATNDRGEMLGYDAFKKLVLKVMEDPGENPIEKVFQKVREFSDPVPWGDDATIVIIQCNKKPGIGIHSAV